MLEADSRSPGFRHAEDYRARIHRVIDHIEKHLQDELALDELARVACFSPFHFHRIFGALVGESLFRFILRLRLEKAASQLLALRRKSVTAIALDCGFSSSAAFARAFRAEFGMSASAWREGGGKRWMAARRGLVMEGAEAAGEHAAGLDARGVEAPGPEGEGVVPADRKEGQTDRKEGKALRKPGKASRKALRYTGTCLEPEGSEAQHLDYGRRIAMQVKEAQSVRIEISSPMTVAYVRHVGPYAGDAALFQRLFAQLMRWAGPRGLIRFPETKILTIYHDNPDITEAEKLRISACITVPPGTVAEGEVGVTEVPGGKCAFARFEVDSSEFGAAWNWLCGVWLPSSGYQPDDRPCYELNLNDPEQHPEKKHIVEICLPVAPL